MEELRNTRAWLDAGPPGDLVGLVKVFAEQVTAHVVHQARLELAAPARLEPWLTVEEAAQHAQVSDKTILGWIRCGRLNAGGAGKLTRVKATDVDACLRRLAAEERARSDEPVSVRAQKVVERLKAG